MPIAALILRRRRSDILRLMKLTRVIGRVFLGPASVALAGCCAYLLGGYECIAEPGAFSGRADCASVSFCSK
jgi:hypothetical protein